MRMANQRMLQSSWTSAAARRAPAARRAARTQVPDGSGDGPRGRASARLQPRGTLPRRASAFSIAAWGKRVTGAGWPSAVRSRGRDDAFSAVLYLAPEGIGPLAEKLRRLLARYRVRESSPAARTPRRWPGSAGSSRSCPRGSAGSVGAGRGFLDDCLDRRLDAGVTADEFEGQPGAGRGVQQLRDDRRDVPPGHPPGDPVFGEVAGGQGDQAGARVVREMAGPQDRPVQVGAAGEVAVGRALGTQVGGEARVGSGRGSRSAPIEESWTSRRTPARWAASAKSTAPPWSTAWVRAMPPCPPAPAANTAASAPARSAASCSTPTDSRSHSSASAPAACSSCAWSDLRINPTGVSPRSARIRSSCSAT